MSSSASPSPSYKYLALAGGLSLVATGLLVAYRIWQLPMGSPLTLFATTPPNPCPGSAADLTAWLQDSPDLSATSGVSDPCSPRLATASPNIDLGSLLERDRGVFLLGSAWPDIHEKARQAKVPIIMYHDILPTKEVFFDVTPQELAEDFELIRQQGLTPIHLDWLIAHLQTGLPLPDKPILLTFDDGYGGHFQHVYPLLKKYGYPAVFSIYTRKVDAQSGRSSVTWEQLQKMAADPLVTIASHTVSHPENLTTLNDADLKQEIEQSKRILENRLGIPIQYFTYPAGHSDERVEALVAETGYRAALSMDDANEHFANESKNLLVLGRFGQSNLEKVVDLAWGGPPLPRSDGGFNFISSVSQQKHTVDGISLTLIAGGQPKTIHADSRYQVPEIIAETGAIAAVDGGFFSLKYLDSNVMIGPVMSSSHGLFIPGYRGELGKLEGRPLILIGPDAVKFIPFDPDKHNDLLGVVREMENVTDAFVGAAWLVKNSQAQPAEAFGTLFDFDAYRHRAFWGINQAGQPVIGVTHAPVDSVSLGQILASLGLRDAVMLDSGASTSLAYQEQSLVGYTPRPVPHVVALFPPEKAATASAETRNFLAEFQVWLPGSQQDSPSNP